MDGSSQVSVANSRRKMLYLVVCYTCHEAGFGSADRASIETLVEMIQSLLYEIGRSSQAYCELSGRTEPLISDIVMALIDMGVNIEGLASYGKRSTRIMLPTPSLAPKQTAPKILQAGTKKPHTFYIPDYFPSFPDPHSYIKTLTHKQPVTEYEAIREKAASQKKDVERALTRFMAKTSESNLMHSLFPDEQMVHLFPLISITLHPKPYLVALQPEDQIFELEVAEKKVASKKPEKTEEATEVEVDLGSADVNNVNANAPGQTDNNQTQAGENQSQANNDSDIPDNPYLRPPKIAKRRQRK